MPRRSGFTLVELLIYIAITSIALLLFTNFMVDTSAQAARARQLQELQQNARLVVDRMSQVARSASTLSTTATSFTAGSTTIAYDSGNKKITLGASDLTSSKISVDSFSVSPVPAPAAPQVITVSFTLSTLNSSPIQSLPITISLVPHSQLYQ